MIYIWDEHLEFYDTLENKSDFINRQISSAKEAELSERDFREKNDAWAKDQNADKVPKLEGIDDPSHPDWHPDPRIRETRKQISAMNERDTENLRKSRGL